LGVSVRVNMAKRLQQRRIEKDVRRDQARNLTFRSPTSFGSLHPSYIHPWSSSAARDQANVDITSGLARTSVADQ
jgi:hypothetical protein